LSSNKSTRVSARRYAEKQPYRTKVKNMISETRKAILEGNKEKAQEYGNTPVSALDKASQKNALHSNNTSRKKSRLLRQINHLLKSE
jgi:small subunit ribosomal protein S20